MKNDGRYGESYDVRFSERSDVLRERRGEVRLLPSAGRLTRRNQGGGLQIGRSEATRGQRLGRKGWRADSGPPAALHLSRRSRRVALNQTRPVMMNEANRP